jgi:hypothetical protein
MHRPREGGDEPAASRSRAGCARVSQTAARARRPPFAAAPSGPCGSAPRPRPHSSSWLRRQDQQAAQTGPADWAVGERRADAGAHPPDLCKALGIFLSSDRFTSSSSHLQRGRSHGGCCDMSWDQSAVPGACPFSSMHVTASPGVRHLHAHTEFPCISDRGGSPEVLQVLDPLEEAHHDAACARAEHQCQPSCVDSHKSPSLGILAEPAGIAAHGRTLHATEAREAHRQRRKCPAGLECHARAG